MPEQIPVVMRLAQVDGFIFGLMAVSVLTTSLRLYGRVCVFRAIGVDDILIANAVTLIIVDSAIQHLKISQAFPKVDLNRLNPFEIMKVVMPNITRAILFAFVHGHLYVPALGIVKLSILAFLHRLTINKAHRYALYFVAALIIGWTICHFILSFLMVIPLKAYFTVASNDGRRLVSHITIQTTNASFQAAFDVIIILLPLPVLAKIKTTNRAKAALTVTYVLGSLSLATTLVRLAKAIMFHQNSYIHTGSFFENIKRQTDSMLQLTTWTVIELNTACICANVPGLAALIQLYVKKINSQFSTHRGWGSELKRAFNSAKSREAVETSSGSKSTSGSKSMLWPPTEDPVNEKVQGYDSAILRRTEISMDVESNNFNDIRNEWNSPVWK